MDNPLDQITLADLQLLQRGLLLGNKAVIETIESECVRVHLAEPGRWYDTRPMLDPHEHAPQIIDEAAEALSYAESAGLVRRHPEQRYIVCLLWSAQS